MPARKAFIIWLNLVWGPVDEAIKYYYFFFEAENDGNGGKKRMHMEGFLKRKVMVTNIPITYEVSCS